VAHALAASDYQSEVLRMSRIPGAVLFSILACGTVAAHGREHAIPHISLSAPIAAQPLSLALQAWARQAGMQVMYATEIAAGLQTRGVPAGLTAQAALERLLDGTGLQFRVLNDRAISVVRKSSEEAVPVPGSQTGPARGAGDPEASHVNEAAEETLRLSRADPDEQRSADSAAFAAERHVSLEEVVVTGSHIRGAEPVAPVLVFTREDFDRAGAATPQEFLALLPQNFGGAQSADTTESSVPGLTFDQGYGSSVSLRGVGGSSTLILIDGRRMAAAGAASYSDVSMIPLAAVERIEVMPDGASALYGSDAIGGVVNFIMRKDFSGGETRLRYADTTEGGLAQRQASQLLGSQWDSGNALLSYEFVDQDLLDRTDRSFSANAPGTNNGPRPLIPAQRSHAVSVFAKQALPGRLSLSANGLYAQRSGDSFSWDPTAEIISNTDVRRQQYGGGLGMTIGIAESWQAQVNGNFNKSLMDRTNLSPAQRFDFDSVADLWSAEALLSGDLFRLPWGGVKLAIGASYLAESLSRHDYVNGVPRVSIRGDTRSTRSAFTELSIPVGERGDLPRAPLVVSLSGRYEDHGSSGNTFDPKVGLRWTPLRSLGLFATYGTSFKTPSLADLQESPTINVTGLLNVANPPGAPVRALQRQGNNSALVEETAKTFSGGLDFNLTFGDGLQGSLSFFDIDYTDRVARVSASAANVLALPAYQSLVIRRGDVPDAQFDALLTDYLSGTDARVLGCPVPVNPATGACAAPLAPIRAIVDRRLQNFSDMKVQGLDLSLNQRVRLGEHRLSFALNASYFLKFEQVVDPVSPAQDILDTLYNPVDRRVRATANWSRAAWSASLGINHTGGYSTRDSLFRGDNSPMPLTTIDSWTTFDLALGYQTQGDRSWMGDVGISLNVSNLFDKDPPFVDDRYIGLGYDPANADPRGRLVSLLIRKNW
jgi:iron complex outermembrane recepter protein